MQGKTESYVLRVACGFHMKRAEVQDTVVFMRKSWSHDTANVEMLLLNGLWNCYHFAIKVLRMFWGSNFILLIETINLLTNHSLLRSKGYRS